MDNTGRDKRLALLAGRQAGTFSFRQAVELGFPSSTVARRVRTGGWERLYPGVFAFPGPSTRERDLWGAVLAAGPRSAISHESSALIHGAEHLPHHPITLTNPHRWHHRIGGIFVHQIDDLGAVDVVHWQGLPVSSPARCVVELGATQSYGVLGRVADDLINSKRTSLRQIERAFCRVARPGKPGMLNVARLIDERLDGEPPPNSELERLMFQTLDAGGLPRPRRSLPLPGRGPIRGVVDAGYPEAKLLLEVDGRRWHARIHAARIDRARDVQAARAGWQTLRFGFEELSADPAEVCLIVADTLAERARLLVA